ncbi:hypothetical protein OIU79_015709 [Salix purpurea]|uniref:Uncharacterized protein n=1 Tax=Salix purpurea TaxID=77065 RepID=A0A9Q0SQJ3_SALPP|nr:hypothetical protein OIU79_015709 [Salix purpurea]
MGCLGSKLEREFDWHGRAEQSRAILGLWLEKVGEKPFSTFFLFPFSYDTHRFVSASLSLPSPLLSIRSRC